MAVEYYPIDHKVPEDQDSPRDGKRDYSYGAATVDEEEEERLNKLAAADRVSPFIALCVRDA
jgi:hypothetical protein